MAKRRPKDLKFLKNVRATKYRAVKTIIDGRKFDSKTEARYYSELLLREKAGEISDIRCQVSFDLVVEGLKVCRYVADFVFFENGAEKVVDVKSDYTAKMPIFRLKKKLMKAILKIDVIEVLG